PRAYLQHALTVEPPSSILLQRHGCNLTTPSDRKYFERYAIGAIYDQGTGSVAGRSSDRAEVLSTGDRWRTLDDGADRPTRGTHPTTAAKARSANTGAEVGHRKRAGTPRQSPGDDLGRYLPGVKLEKGARCRTGRSREIARRVYKHRTLVARFTESGRVIAKENLSNARPQT